MISGIDIIVTVGVIALIFMLCCLVGLVTLDMYYQVKDRQRREFKLKFK